MELLIESGSCKLTLSVSASQSSRPTDLNPLRYNAYIPSDKFW